MPAANNGTFLFRVQVFYFSTNNNNLQQPKTSHLSHNVAMYKLFSS